MSSSSISIPVQYQMLFLEFYCYVACYIHLPLLVISSSSSLSLSSSSSSGMFVFAFILGLQLYFVSYLHCQSVVLCKVGGDESDRFLPSPSLKSSSVSASAMVAADTHWFAAMLLRAFYVVAMATRLLLQYPVITSA